MPLTWRLHMFLELKLWRYDWCSPHLLAQASGKLSHFIKQPLCFGTRHPLSVNPHWTLRNRKRGGCEWAGGEGGAPPCVMRCAARIPETMSSAGSVSLFILSRTKRHVSRHTVSDVLSGRLQMGSIFNECSLSCCHPLCLHLPPLQSTRATLFYFWLTEGTTCSGRNYRLT